MGVEASRGNGDKRALAPLAANNYTVPGIADNTNRNDGSGKNILSPKLRQLIAFSVD
ncbi:MAG: hypothetical protein ACI9BW_004783 [Gammaproteobacteria bacterium]|jgi:hypothetical protein